MNAWLLEIWAAPAALGFALLFNVPPRALWMCGALAILGHAARKLVLTMHGDIVLGTLVAAILIGLIAEWWSTRRNEPAIIYAISAAIPMVPGTYMYKAVQALLGIATLPVGESGQELLVAAGVSGVKAGMIVLALAFGIAAPLLLLPKRN
ncbi:MULTISPECIES: threonine/serine exporter family protein [Deefgea]|uniref:Threonine/serine exporter n=1 Tax=Deefgea chitinilytica TaxID=570276 RepID=A0ABS2CHH1_9NEIS|nr:MULTISPECIES: threonine/serine exporter family protein [Deefgea]MBM5572888.1 threonine/serine exporter [Deefgea chitinilytica]MBM9890124.1 threonine/serine exporter family protein [Deefgea sp. CFH1-16]